jgi:hypothetical protein
MHRMCHLIGARVAKWPLNVAVQLKRNLEAAEHRRVDETTIGGGLVEKLSIPVLLDGGVDLGDLGGVLGGARRVAHGRGELAADLHGELKVDEIPKDARGDDLFPEIAGRHRAPVVDNPVEIVGDDAAVERLVVAGPEILLNIGATDSTTSEKMLRKQEERGGADGRTVSLRTAPGAGEDVAVGKIELGLGANVDVVRIRLV